MSSATDGDGSYSASGAATLNCSCYGQLGASGGPSTIVPPAPVITGIADSVTNSNTIYQGASGYLAIYGTALTACGLNPSPTVTGDGSVTISLYWASNTQVNVAYTVAAGAALGQHTLALQTAQGTGRGTVAVTAPVYNVTVTNSGTTVSSGSTQYITAAPAMPAISAQAKGSGTYSTQWSATVSYARPDGSGTNVNTFGPATTTGTTSWLVPWNGNFVGGTATLSWTINSNPPGSLTFQIAGTNPSDSAIDSQIASESPPWFFTRMVSHESGYLQFNTSGTPLYSNDSGYGLTQVTTSNAQDLWNWAGNIAAGLSVLNGDQSGAYSFWQSQITQWQQFNSGADNNGKPPSPQLGPPPSNNAGGPCLFAYPVVAGTYGYNDANWIKAYNGAAQYFAYIVVQSGTSATWVTNNDPANYVHDVCQAPVL